MNTTAESLAQNPILQPTASELEALRGLVSDLGLEIYSIEYTGAIGAAA